MTTTRVFVVARAPAMRAGLRAMIAAAEGFDLRVAGEASSPAQSPPGFSEADVVLVAGEDLLEETAQAVAEEGAPALLLLSEDERSVPRVRSLSLPGWGVALPDASSEELAAALLAVAQGLVVIPAQLTESLLGEPFEKEPPEPLTAREREVLELLGRGLSNKLIAGQLHISEHTVKFHVSSLYAKLGVNSRAGAVSQGARYGLISL